MSKKKTHEEYVEEVKKINPNIEVIDKYNGAKIKILHKCLLHNIKWKIAPNNILQGQGCELCRREKIADYHYKTTEQYIKEINNINSYIEVVSSYIDAKTPILHKCLLHNIEWKTAPSNVLQGQGCELCGREKIRKKNNKTHEEYVSEIRIINPNIIALDKYINVNTPILHKCLIDNYEWYTAPANILYNNGCPKCSKRFRRTHDDYINEASIANPNIEVLEKFNGMQIPILHKCKLHNVKWKVIPENILNGHGCKKCGVKKIGDKNRKTHKEYVDELKVTNKDIAVIDTYVNSYTSILHKCLIDGYEWYASPLNILSGCGCPQCQESYGERLIRQWLNKYNISYEFQKIFKDCRDVKPLPFDFYLSDYNMAIEYDGEQHYEPVEYFGGQKSFEYTQRHDKIKNEYCENNNIKLLRIPYFKNIEEELNNFLFI